ncbi:MAG: ribosomal protein L7/L12 [Leptolyngbyaceae cyanobacterium]
MATIPVLKQGAAIALLVVGGLCLGRAVETALDRNPNRVGKRETITAGILLGGTATVGGSGLALSAYRQRRRAGVAELQAVFFNLVKAGRGKITPLRFAMEAQITGQAATAYLNEQARQYDATFQVDQEGGITYCFNLGTVDSHLLRPPPPELAFDVILEAVPPVKQRDIIRTVQTLTGLDWKAVKALVRKLPQPIQQRASQKTAEEFKAALEAVGAQVALVLNTER